MGKALDILIQPCPPGDDRFEDWSQAATAAMTAPAGSPQRQTAVDELREMGFAVLEPNQTPDPPPGPGEPQPRTGPRPTTQHAGPFPDTAAQGQTPPTPA